MPPIPEDLSHLAAASPADLRQSLRLVDVETPLGDLERLSAALQDRAIRLLREGSRPDLTEESILLHGFLETDAGRSLAGREPRIAGQWQALANLSLAASRRFDRPAVDSLLRGLGRSREVLEALAREKQPMPRVRLRKALEIEESHLSHLLRDLEEADLVVRYKPEGTKHVVVELGPVGREVVNQSIRPGWVDVVLGLVETIRHGGRISRTQSALASELIAAGAPERDAVDLADSFAGCNRTEDEADAAFVAEYERESLDFAASQRTLGDRAPRDLFSGALAP